MTNRKMWKQKDGSKIRIKDMENSHLVNTIKMLERYAEAETDRALKSAYEMASWVSGDMATMLIENDIDALENREPIEGLYNDDHIYWDLWNEALDRGIL